MRRARTRGLIAIETITPEGEERTIAISDLHRLPGSTPHLETNLLRGEMITAVTLPPAPPGRQIYRKVRDRASFAFALVSVAAIIHTRAGGVQGARIAMGGVATKLWRAHEAERVLAGQPATERVYTAAAEAALAGAQDREHNAFKIALAKRTVRHTLAEAARSA